MNATEILDFNIQTEIIKQLLSNDLSEDSEYSEYNLRSSVKRQLEVYLSDRALGNNSVSLRCTSKVQTTAKNVQLYRCDLSTYEEDDDFESSIIIFGDVMVNEDAVEVKNIKIAA